VLTEDPRSKTLAKEFYWPDAYNYELGDGTVVTASAILPGIKWAYEFNEEPEKTKPVKFIEICSE
jgi:hypothetical protein